MIINDQLNRKLQISNVPKRIISLVPSQTELLVDLGLETSLIGVTKFCVHPKHIKTSKTIVGGTKTIKLDIVKSLKPDLIICNKEENTPEIIQGLETIAPVYVSDINSIDEMLVFIDDLGGICDVFDAANVLIRKIKTEVASLQQRINKKLKSKVAYFIWRDPWMVVGDETFINSMLQLNNFENVFASKKRYPEIVLTNEKLKEATHIFLSSEPFPFKQKDVDALQKLVPQAKILLVDGELFSWYGSRMLKAIRYFKEQHLAGW